MPRQHRTRTPFAQGDLVDVGSADVPAVVLSGDVRPMLQRGPRHPVIGVAVRLAGGWWEPAFFLAEDVRLRGELVASLG